MKKKTYIFDVIAQRQTALELQRYQQIGVQYRLYVQIYYIYTYYYSFMMDTKLTLKLDEEVIKQAKIYAASQHRSLSALIEDYLKSLIRKSGNDQASEEIEITPFVKSMSSGISLPPELDAKEAYRGHQLNKYR